MPLLVLWLRALETFIILRLCAFRTTLALSVFVRFFVYGFLVGPFAGAGFWLLFSPFATYGSVVARIFPVLNGMAILLVLGIPVLALYRSVGPRAGLSIADAFLLAWSCGFGLDCQSQLFAYLQSFAPKDFALLPPGPVDFISCSYLAALPIMALAAALRFSRNRWVACGLFAITMIYSGLVYAGSISTFLLQRDFAYWTAFLGLIALELFEFWRTRPAPGAPGELSVSAEWRATIIALLTGKWRDFRRAERRFRLTLRAQLIEFERGRDKASFQLRQLANQSRQHRDAPPRPAGFIPRLRSYWLQGALLLLLLLLFVPGLDTLKRGFWDLPFLHAGVNDMDVTLFSLLLGCFVLWRFLSAPNHALPGGEPDNEVGFTGDQAILRVAVVTVIFLFFYGSSVNQLYPLFNPISWLPPQFLGSLVLLITASAIGLQLPASLRWRGAPISDRRRAAIQHSLQVAVLVIGAWVCFSPFRSIQVYLHKYYGASFYNRFGGSGNQAVESMTSFLMLPVTYGVFFLLFRGAARARAFLCEEPQVKPQSQARAAAAN